MDTPYATTSTGAQRRATTDCKSEQRMSPAVTSTTNATTNSRRSKERGARLPTWWTGGHVGEEHDAGVPSHIRVPRFSGALVDECSYDEFRESHNVVVIGGDGTVVCHWLVRGEQRPCVLLKLRIVGERRQRCVAGRELDRGVMVRLHAVTSRMARKAWQFVALCRVACPKRRSEIQSRALAATSSSQARGQSWQKKKKGGEQKCLEGDEATKHACSAKWRRFAVLLSVSTSSLFSPPVLHALEFSVSACVRWFDLCPSVLTAARLLRPTSYHCTMFLTIS